MNRRDNKGFLAALTAVFAGCLLCTGCLEHFGYSNKSLYPEELGSVYVKMFDNRSFRRGVEYELSDALAKRIEAHTPYKVVSSEERADSVISGQVNAVGIRVLSAEHKTGRALEREVWLEATVKWKDLKTGQMLVDSEKVISSASYSKWQNQGFEYASSLAANNLAKEIVQAMESGW